MNERDRPITTLPRVKKVYELIGKITVCWNSVETLWYLLYSCVMHKTPRNIVDKNFRDIPTGSKQRLLALTIAEEAFIEHPKLLEEFKFLKSRTDELARKRNALIHGVYIFDNLNGEPSLRIAPMGSINRQPNSLSSFGNELLEEFQAIFDEIYSHENKLDEFRMILAQEFLPESHKNLPYSPEELSSMPVEFRKRLPREKLERIAPERLRSPD